LASQGHDHLDHDHHNHESFNFEINRYHLGANAIGEEEKKEEDKEDATEEEEDEDLTFLGEPHIAEDGDLNFPAWNRLIACMCMTGKNLIRYPIS